MTDFIQRAIDDRRLGLALHYPFLHAAVVGLSARSTLEFGAGGSTRVFLNALLQTDRDADGTHEWRHLSVSTESRESIEHRHDVAGFGHRWTHRCGLSESARDALPEVASLDIALHDGSHAADVVAADVAWAWPRLRRFGLLLVHDTQHSYVGEDVRAGLASGLSGARFTVTTLPYGFGLTIVRREDGDEPVRPAVAKRGGPHTTSLVTVFIGDGR